MTLSFARRSSAPRSRRRATVAAVLAVAAGPLLAAPSAQAGAVAYGATLDRETALVSARDGAQSTTLAITLSADREARATERMRPAIVIPVPAAPQVTELEGPAAAIFAELDMATAPRTVSTETARQRGDDVPRPDPGPLANYERTDLPAGDYAALTAWQDRHGLTTPPRQARELRRYAEAGWAFVGLRLNGPVASEQTVRPLRLEFASDRIRFPMRVLGAGDDAVSVSLYVAGPHRVIAPGFDTYHAGWTVDLAPTPNPDAQSLLGGEEFLTKLGTIGTPPDEITADLATEQGVSDRLFRSSVDFPFESEAGFATAPLPDENAPEVPFEGPAGWLWVVLLGGVVALVVLTGLVLRWRSSRS